jgi:hypothetical protein
MHSLLGADRLDRVAGNDSLARNIAAATADGKDAPLVVVRRGGGGGGGFSGGGRGGS